MRKMKSAKDKLSYGAKTISDLFRNSNFIQIFPTTPHMVNALNILS